MSEKALLPLTMTVEGLTPGRAVEFCWWDEFGNLREEYTVTQDGAIATVTVDSHPENVIYAGFPWPVSTERDFIGYEAVTNNIEFLYPSSGLIQIRFKAGATTGAVVKAKFRY